MASQKNFENLLSMLQENAREDYRKTPQYTHDREKLGKMDIDCVNMLIGDEREFARECFELLACSADEEMRFLYRCGIRDCVHILRALDIVR